MAGRNQHFIPQFFQRAFGVSSSGRPKHIWTFAKGADPELGLIKETAVAWDFYSPPSPDGSATLDDKITGIETPLARQVRAVRDLNAGASVDAAVAAEIVTRLAPRTSHLRKTMASGFQHLMVSARETFSDPEALSRMMGLDTDEPADVFHKHFAGILRDRPEFRVLGLPEPLLERMAFRIAKERLDDTMMEVASFAETVVGQIVEGAPDMVRTGHNRALDSTDDVNVRRELLQTFAWTIEQAPPEGAVIPDCMAIASEAGAAMLPLMFVGKDVDAVLLPLTASKVLVGRRDASIPIDVSDLNRDAASCSHEFFLAATDDDRLKSLISLIGERTLRYFEDVTEEVISELVPMSTRPNEADESIIAAQPTHLATPDVRYELSFLSVGDEQTVGRISEVVQSVVGAFVRSYPMSRLEGITFASDYPAALRGVDLGRSGARPVETAGPEIGVGIAKRVVVLRDDRAVARLVVSAFVGHHLISEDEAAADWALNVLSNQLALVAMMELVERALPDTLLRPITDPIESLLYSEVDAAIHAYVAADIAGGFGDPDQISATYRELLVGALDRLKTNVDRERLAYREHEDVDQLLAVAMPEVGWVLHFAAQPLGHAAANDRSPMDDEGKLQSALERLQLTQWLVDFQGHLKRFRARLGAWRSFDEFLAFNRHAERLMWAVGLFPWNAPTGPRVEVPWFSDPEAFMAAAARLNDSG